MAVVRPSYILMRSVDRIMRMPTQLICILLFLSSSAALSSDQCDQSYAEVLDSGGSISSYNYPFQYKDNLSCRYTFYLKPRNEDQSVDICFKFYEFDLESSADYCLFDYLEFQSTTSLKYCGRGVWQYGISDPTVPRSSLWFGDSCWTVTGANQFVVDFFSDNVTNAAGYYATFQIQESRTKSDEGSEVQVQKPGLGRAILACNFSLKSDDEVLRCFTSVDGWKRTGDFFTGSLLISDHTIGKGGSFLISSSTSKSILSLRDIYLSAELERCFAFWFLFVGPHSPALKVYISRDQLYERPEWESHPSPQTPSWQMAEVSLKGLTELQIVIATAMPERGWSGGDLDVVAIDDLSVTTGACNGANPSCNFESSNCDWRAVDTLIHSAGILSANGQWSRKTEGAAFTDNGYFISSTNSNNRDLTRSLLISPQVTSPSRAAPRAAGKNSPTYEACFTFVYSFDNDASAISRINLRVVHHDGHLTVPLWSATNRVKGKWVGAEVELVLNQGRPYKIVLEALLKTGLSANLDSFSLVEGTCRAPTPHCLDLNDLQCGDGLCLNSSQVCDGKKDCEDGSDEDETAGCLGPQTLTSSTPPTSSPDVQCSRPECFTTATNCTNQSGESDCATALNKMVVSDGNQLALIISLSMLGLLTLVCFVLSIVGLARRRKSRRNKMSEERNKATAVQSEGSVFYQTLTDSNQSTANLVWPRGTERVARDSSGDDSDVPIMNTSDPNCHLHSVRHSFQRLDASISPDFLVLRNIPGSSSDHGGLPAGGQPLDVNTLQPVIRTSKYILSPDAVRVFGPRGSEPQTLEKMIESFNKHIKTSNTNSSHSCDSSKDSPTSNDSAFNHIYEDIDEAKIKNEPRPKTAPRDGRESMPLSTPARRGGDPRDGRGPGSPEDGQDRSNSIISKAILI